jgi:EpsI family protein
MPLLVGALMVAVAVAAASLRPEPRPSADAAAFSLATLVPTTFDEWKLVEAGSALVVNPQLEQRLGQLYSQHLTRVYQAADGYRVMLSIAYGDDQRSGMQVHLPEVCYPAQGFKVNWRGEGRLGSASTEIPVARMEAQLGARVEPVTYWITFGSQPYASIGALDRRLLELRYALRGEIPDGLLYRVSSIDPDRASAYRRQEQFTAALLAAVGPSGRARLAGTSGS